MRGTLKSAAPAFAGAAWVLSIRAMMHPRKNTAALKLCEIFSKQFYQELDI